MDTLKQLREDLSRLKNTQTLILGIGSELKSDDGAGPLLCRKLTESGIRAEIIDAGTVPENYIRTIVKKSPESIVVVDAVDFNAAAGGMRIFTPDELSSFTFSTHTMSPHLFIDMITEQIDAEFYIIGIRPGTSVFGMEISPEVKESVERLAGILTEIFPPAH